MTGLVRKATLLTVAGLVAASASFAGVPSPANSSVPACVPLVGSSLGVVDPAGLITITVRDLANNPLSGASVVIDASGASDIAICADQLDAAALVNCAAKTTRKFTDALGQVTFTVLGGSNGAGNASSLTNAGKIYANGVLLGSPTLTAYDLDGAGGVGANDLSAWLADFGTLNPYGRSDYDCSGAVGANDLSVWLSLFGNLASGESCVTACP